MCFFVVALFRTGFYAQYTKMKTYPKYSFVAVQPRMRRRHWKEFFLSYAAVCSFFEVLPTFFNHSLICNLLNLNLSPFYMLFNEFHIFSNVCSSNSRETGGMSESDFQLGGFVKTMNHARSTSICCKSSPDFQQIGINNRYEGKTQRKGKSVT